MAELTQPHVWYVATGSMVALWGEVVCGAGRGGVFVCSGPLGVAQGQGEWLTTKIQQNKRDGARGASGARDRQPVRPAMPHAAAVPGLSRLFHRLENRCTILGGSSRNCWLSQFLCRDRVRRSDCDASRWLHLFVIALHMFEFFFTQNRNFLWYRTKLILKNCDSRIISMFCCNGTRKL